MVSLIFLIIIYMEITQVNNNKIKTKDHHKEANFIYVKIISPNFELKYNLSEEETLTRIKKLIRYSNIEKKKKQYLFGQRGHYLENIFLKLKDTKN